MSTEFSGRVLYANGLAAQGVEVRVFDKDKPGKIDDDLTIQEGLSDAGGHFTVIFDPSRYRDYNTIRLSGPLGRLFDPESQEHFLKVPDLSDRYLPYLEFRYSHNGQACQHTAPLGLYQDEFQLPESPPLGFIPSQHGFKFVNRFSGYPFPFTVPQLPGLLEVPKGYGLCGGMSSAAADFLLSGRSFPPIASVPEAATPMHQYLFRRQIDSFGRLGDAVLKVARWTALPDGGKRGTYRRSYEEFWKVRARLDKSEPVVLALIYDRANTPAEIIQNIWNNHQVLAFGYSQDPARNAAIYVYDPNYPGRDDVRLEAERVFVPFAQGDEKPGIWGFRTLQKVGEKVVREVRGFFMMRYKPAEPPSRLEYAYLTEGRPLSSAGSETPISPVESINPGSVHGG
jgi:hypothetical protein